MIIVFILYHVHTFQLQKYKKVQKYANDKDFFCRYQRFLYLCTAVVSNALQVIMAKFMRTIAPVDSLSGMFGKREHSLSGKAIIANVRKVGGNAVGGAPFMYFSVLTKTTYKGSEAQLSWNESFGEISSATRARLRDPGKITADQLAFREQTKYKTLYSYVWNEVRKEREQQNG